MITQEILDFFTEPVAINVGTASAQVRPFFTRSFLIEGEIGSDAINLFIPEVMAGQALADLKENPRIAVFVVNITNFKARQYKGMLVGSRKATADELNRMRAALELSIPVFTGFFGSSAASGWGRYITAPAVCLTMKLEMMYNQTPGPGAGEKI